MRRPNWQIVWNYLSQCEGATIQPYTNNKVEFCIIDNTLCTILQKSILGKDSNQIENVYIPIDISLNDFVKLCENLPESTILNCVFAVGINKIRDKKSKE